VNVLGVLGAASAQRRLECEGRLADGGWKKRKSLTGAMVARLPTEQEVVGSIPTLGWSVLVAQLADRPLHTRKAQGSIPCENFGYFAEGRAFNPPRELLGCFLFSDMV